MTLTQIIRAGATYAGDVSIDVDTAYGTVAIGDDIFMQGDEAYAFIDEAQALWEESGDVSIDEVYAHLAGPYLD
jgi:tryptophanase